MVSRSLLLVLLVLACVQSFTAAESANEPTKCCFTYQPTPIPARHFTAYKVTNYKCTKPGVIFTVKDGRPVCANPDEKWVKDTMMTIDQRLTAWPQPSG